ETERIAEQMIMNIKATFAYCGIHPGKKEDKDGKEVNAFIDKLEAAAKEFSRKREEEREKRYENTRNNSNFPQSSYSSENSNYLENRFYKIYQKGKKYSRLDLMSLRSIINDIEKMEIETIKKFAGNPKVKEEKRYAMIV
ncbi:28972_t:CDS:2, partial [Racocetra persica]